MPRTRSLCDGRPPACSVRRKEEETLERERKEREARRTASMVMAAENQKVPPPAPPGQYDTADADNKIFWTGVIKEDVDPGASVVDRSVTDEDDFSRAAQAICVRRHRVYIAHAEKSPLPPVAVPLRTKS